MLKPKELGWIVGFLEGEGCFQWHRSATGGTALVTASQVQREPLDRLHAYVGGHIYFKIKKRQGKNLRGQDFYVWTCSGPTAAGLMMMLFSDLSPRRQEQVKIALGKWKASKVAFKYRTHCTQGHPYSEENTRIYSNYYNGNPARECRTCRRERYGPKEEAKQRQVRLLERGSA